MVVNDDFPDELWACITNDVKLRESDAVVLEMCNMLKDKGIRFPELLEQAPQALITHIFPWKHMRGTMWGSYTYSQFYAAGRKQTITYMRKPCIGWRMHRKSAQG